MRCIDIIDNKTYIFLEFVQFLDVFSENMFAYKLRTFELLATERTQPLVLRQLLYVSRYKLLNFRNDS